MLCARWWHCVAFVSRACHPGRLYWDCCPGALTLSHWPLGNFRYVIFKRILVTDGWGISCEIALIWMSLYFTDDQSTLVQVMAWCRQAPSHYLNQCWHRSLSPYGITGPQWVKSSYSFEDQAPVDFIYGCPVFKWVTDLSPWRGQRIVAPAMAVTWHAPLQTLHWYVVNLQKSKMYI